MGQQQPSGPPGLDLARLGPYLEAAWAAAGPLTAELIQGGRSNLTYLVRDAAGNRLVVRRPPLGHVLATAHDMGREHRVMTRSPAGRAGAARRCCCARTRTVLGAPFYVMEYVRRHAVPHGATSSRPARPERDPGRWCSALVDTLVELHAVDPAAVGLADFGRPEGFLERQLRRWGKQLDASRSRELPGIDELHAALGRAAARLARARPSCTATTGSTTS